MPCSGCPPRDAGRHDLAIRLQREIVHDGLPRQRFGQQPVQRAVAVELTRKAVEMQSV